MQGDTSTIPCGTPDVTSTGLLISPFTNTFHILAISKEVFPSKDHLARNTQVIFTGFIAAPLMLHI